MDAVEGLHGMGLAVFANGHSVVDVLGEMDGASSPLSKGDGSRPGDQYLLENASLIGGKLPEGVDSEGATARYAQAIELTQATGVRLAVLDTIEGEISDDALSEPLPSLAWWRAAQAGASVYSLTNGGPHLSEGNFPILKLPPGARDLVGDSFESTFLKISLGGQVLKRFLTDCNGARIGAISLTVDGSTPAGFEAISGPEAGC